MIRYIFFYKAKNDYCLSFIICGIHLIIENIRLTVFTMGTRGRIAIEYNGRILCCIWVNCDGYPSFVGKVILTKLQDVYSRDNELTPSIVIKRIQLMATSMIDMLHSASMEMETSVVTTHTVVQKSIRDIWCEHLYVVHINHNATTEITYINTFGCDECDGFEVKCDHHQFKQIVEANGVWENLPKQLQRKTYRQEPSILTKREDDIDTSLSRPCKIHEGF